MTEISEVRITSDNNGRLNSPIVVRLLIYTDSLYKYTEAAHLAAEKAARKAYKETLELHKATVEPIWEIHK